MAFGIFPNHYVAFRKVDSKADNKAMLLAPGDCSLGFLMASKGDVWHFPVKQGFPRLTTRFSKADNKAMQGPFWPLVIVPLPPK